ncbi:Mu transposase domain-containing protein [Streptomyces vinaceus]
MAERQLRHVGKDCLVAFDGNLYSVSARRIRPRRLVEVRATKSQVMLHGTLADATTRRRCGSSVTASARRRPARATTSTLGIQRNWVI